MGICLRNIVARGLALALACAVAAGCVQDTAGSASARKRVIVVSPRPPGPMPVAGFARRLALETGAEVTIREVDILSHEAIADAARRMVREHPALIISPTSEMVYGLREVTETIPILFVTMADPIQSSLVSDEARPRGNVSGFTFHVPTEPKQLELLKRAFPAIRRVGVVGDRWLFTSTSFRMLADAARGPLAIGIERVHFEDALELERALAQPAAASVDAWIVPQGTATFRFAREVVALLGATGKPAIFGSENFVRLGGLMSYSPSFEDPSERVVDMAKSVLQGFPVGELPVERPQTFRFAVNTATWGRIVPPPPRRILLLATDFYGADGKP
jgi:putative ABC transport system substrate-binding protein